MTSREFGEAEEIEERAGIELGPCTKEDRDRVVTVPEHNSWYAQALCITQRQKVELRDEWFSHKYQNLLLSIVMCDNSTRAAHDCKSPAEIYEFVQSNAFFFTH